MTEKELESPSSNQTEDQVLDNAVDHAHQEAEDLQESVAEENHQVPLSALQKERKRRQQEEQARREAELRAQWLEEQYSTRQQQTEDDDSSYESLTKGEYQQQAAKTEQEIIRKVSETSWKNSHPDKCEIVNERLPELLKKKPNLAYAISASENRYQEAWELLQRYSDAPKPKREQERTQAPGSPAAAPKVKGVSQGMDVMKMTDKEFKEWMSSKSRRRAI